MTTRSGTPETVLAGPKQQQQHPNGHHMSGAGCGGEGCVARDPWPVHHVRYRGNFCRLCTSCVLRYHPGSFCTSCFDVVDSAAGRAPPQPSLVHCASCPSVCHATCLDGPEKAAVYVCPACANPGGCFYFPLDPDGDVSGSPTKRIRVLDGSIEREKARMEGQRHRTINRDSAKVLLVAARLASASMSRAVAFARSEAERKAKDAVVAKKKAKEMLEKVLVAAKREREKRSDVRGPARAVPELQKVPMNVGNVVASMVAPKRKLYTENEQWMKVEEVMPLAQRSPVRAIPEKERVRVAIPNGHVNHVLALPTTVAQDVRKLDIAGENGSLPSSKGCVTAESKGGSPKVSAECGLAVRSPPIKQDSSATKTNPKAVFTGMRDKTSLSS